jgi:hypothetical protein
MVAARPGAEDEASAAQPIERHGLARDDLRSAPRNRGDHRTDTDSLGAQCDGRHRRPRIDDLVNPRPADVIPDEIAVPTRLFRRRGQFGVEARVGQRPEDRHADPKSHAWTLAPAYDKCARVSLSDDQISPALSYISVAVR